MSKYQRDLFDMWWKRWTQQGFASLLPYRRLKDRRHANIEVGDLCLLNYDNMVNGTYRLCQVLINEISTSGRGRTVKVGYKESRSLAGRKNEATPRKEIVVSMVRLVLLVTGDKVELMRTLTNYELRVLGACRPRLRSDTAEHDDNVTDVLPKGSLRLLEMATKVKDTQCDAM